MSDSNILDDFFEDEVKAPYFIFYSLALILITYHALIFYVVDADKIIARNELQSYSINFNETTSSSSEEIFVQENTHTLEYEVDEMMFEQYHGFGYLLVTISYVETSGIPFDSCDTVSVSMSPTNAIADWQNINNTLSGTSNDCSDISLKLYIYPNYNSENLTVVGSTPEEIINLWTDKNQGVGVFEIDIDVSASSPAPFPSPQDNGEEITVTLSPVFFDVIIE